VDYNSLPRYEQPTETPEVPPAIENVPIYRREWVVSLLLLGGLFLCPPALWAVCILCLTGDIYRNKVGEDGSLVRWYWPNKLAAVLLLVLQLIMVAARLGRLPPVAP
jgi:hypothetical protein